MNFLYRRSPLLAWTQKKQVPRPLIKHLLLLICFLFPLVGYCTDYYFSTSIGDDNRSITEAQNPATPWKTIDKLNAVASALMGGDRVLFAAGEVFYGTINIVKGGDSGNPIVYTTYGTGAPAIITSLEEITSWRSVGGGLFEASIPNLQSSSVQIIQVNGLPKEIGRYPNPSDSRYLDIVSINSPNSLNGQPSSFDFSGGEIVIRKNNWIIDRHPITSTSGSTINYETINTPYEAKHGYGYFIQNHVNALDIFGEWAYNSNQKTITAYLGSTSVASVEIKVANRDYLVTNQPYVKNITFSNLHFTGANKNIFQITKSGNFKVENCIVESAGENGVYMEEVPDLTFNENTFKNNLNSGIFVFYGSPRISVTDNLFENIMPYEGMGKSSDLQSIGVYIGSDSDNSLIANNRLLNIGYNGIHFGGDYTIVKQNLIDGFCIYKQDGGGIYTNSDGQVNNNNAGREIFQNIILNGVGSIEGNEEKVFLANGIYADDVAAGIHIYQNTIARVSGNGIFLHNNHDLQITDNLIFKVPTQILATHDPIGTPIRDITIENNQLSRIFDEELVFDFNSIDYDLAEFGIVDNNYFLDPYNADFIFYSRDPGDGPIGVTQNLDSWRESFGYDMSSNKPRFNLQRYEVVTSEPIKSSTFDSNIDIVAGTYGGVSEWIPNGITGGSLSIVPNEGEDVLAYIQIGAVEAGEEILIEFDSKSSIENKEIQLFLEKTFDDNQEGTVRYFSTSLEPEKIQILFIANVSTSNESIVIKIPSPSEPVIFDNMNISSVTTEELNILEYMFFEYNYSDEEITVPLPGLYRNAKNEIFNQQVTIPPYQSVLLVKVQYEIPDLPPSPIEISITAPTPNQQFYTSDDIVIDTEISDPTGVLLNKVYLYRGDSVLARLYEPPFRYTWSNPIPGSHNLKAVAFDMVGRTSESELVPILVGIGGPPNLPPTVEITFPSDNQNIDLGNDVLISTLPNDEDGTVDRVEIYVDNELLGTVNQAPYELTWTPATIQSYTLSSIVYDDQGASGNSESILVNITEPPTPNLPPSIQIIDPVEGKNLLFGQPIPITTDPEDPENEIDRVEFFTGNQLIGTTTTAPFSFNWTNASSGPQAIKSVIYDDEGLSAESDAVNINVIDTSMVNFPPVVILEEPPRESVIGSGALLKVLATIYDPENDVERVEFYANDILVGTLQSDPFEIDWPVALEVGTYLVYALAYDSGGNSSKSGNIILHVIPESEENLPPTISISQPPHGEDYNYNEKLVIKTNPYDAENEISSVSIFADGELLALIDEAPYDYEWTNIPMGSHQLYAVVTDGDGQTGTSEIVEFTISNYAPSITILEPLDGQVFAPGESIVIKTEVTDPENEIEHVEFFYNEEIVGLVTDAPYEFVLEDLPVGTYTLKTKVFDALGLTAESQRPTITVQENEPPSIALVYPEDGQVFNLGDNVLIQTDPIDPENEIDRVEFFFNDQILATVAEAPYEYNWISPPAGSYVLKTRVYDETGLSAVSESSTILVRENLPPTINLITPVDGKIFSLGENILILTNASDPGDIIQKVEFFANDVLLATKTRRPFIFRWSSPDQGSYSIKAIAYDRSGQTGESQTANIVVQENQPPTISIIEPVDGQVFNLGEDILIRTLPADPEGQIEHVEFFYNEQIVGLVTEAPYEFNLVDLPVGSYTLKTKVFDAQGLTAESERPTIVVRENLPPTVELTEPVDGQVFNLGEDILIQASADDPEGEIQKVEFFADDELIGTATEAPFEFNWISPEVGTYVIKAVVTDESGFTAESESASITVRENRPPTVELTAPIDGQVVNLGENVLIQASADDPEGEIQKVEFFADDELIGTVTEAPYEFNWISPAEGTYALSAIAYDAFGLRGESEEARIIVRGNQPPTISILEPIDGQIFNLGEDILIRTLPVDPEGEIEHVEFFYNEQIVGLVTEAPYQFNLVDLPAGSYTLKTKVFDAQGLTAESERPTIVIRENLPPTVELTEPVDGQIFNLGEDVLIQASADDPEGEIQKVEFFADDELIATVTEAPYEFNWISPEEGTYALRAIAYDAFGLTGESEEARIIVRGNQPPTIRIIEPVDGQIFNLGEDVLIRTLPADPEGEIEHVEFFYNEDIVGLVTEAPWEFTLENLPIGTYTLKTKVFDAEGLTAESERPTIVVQGNQAPTINIIQPIDGQVFELGEDVLIRTRPNDPEDRIQHVEFFYNEDIVGLVTEAPWEFNLENLPIGTYTIKTKVFDQDGLTAESERPTIRVVRNANLLLRSEQPTVVAVPNPAINFVNLDFYHFEQVVNLSIEIVDMKGNHVDTIVVDKPGESIKLDISAYAPGVYLFKILGDNHIQITEKVIKQ